METPEVAPTRLVARMPSAGARRALLELTLQNPTDTRLRLRRQDAVLVELSSGADRLTARARALGVLEPGAAGSARVHIDVPPLAPPGEYAGTLEIAGQRRAIALVIPLRQRVAVAPGRVVLAGDAERPVVALSFTNHGNTEAIVAEPAAVRLDPRERTCRALRRALELAAAPDKPVPIVEALVRAAAEGAAADPILVGTLTDGPVTLAPGETRLVRLTLRVPRTPRGSYRGRLVIGGRPLLVDIHSTGHNGGEA
jgi:hypothetical protein